MVQVMGTDDFEPIRRIALLEHSSDAVMPRYDAARYIAVRHDHRKDGERPRIRDFGLWHVHS